MTLKDAYGEFIETKKMAGCAPKTISDYSSFIGMYVRYVGPNIHVENITPQMTKKYILNVMEKNISKSSKSTYIRNMKIFLKWIETECNLNINTKKICVPKAGRSLPHIYSNSEIKQIFAAIESDEEWIVSRNRAAIALMLDSGLRQSEVCCLQIDDIKLDAKMIVVLGKGNKTRLVPLGNTSKTLIIQYMKIRPFQSQAIFVSKNGYPLTQDALKHVLYKLSIKLPFTVSSHKLRHNFATNYCIDQYTECGMVDIYTLMVIMGHENVKTTEIYLHHAKEILAARQHVSHLDRFMDKSAYY